jgi:hypothetical protein
MYDICIRIHLYIHVCVCVCCVCVCVYDVIYICIQVAHLQDDSEASVARSIRLVSQSQQVGQETALLVKAQTEQVLCACTTRKCKQHISNIYLHTHTHTHIHKYMYLCVYIYMNLREVLRAALHT